MTFGPLYPFWYGLEASHPPPGDGAVTYSSITANNDYQNIKFSPDGTHFFLTSDMGVSACRVRHWTLSTPYDIDTRTSQTSIDWR